VCFYASQCTISARFFLHNIHYTDKIILKRVSNLLLQLFSTLFELLKLNHSLRDPIDQESTRAVKRQNGAALQLAIFCVLWP